MLVEVFYTLSNGAGEEVTTKILKRHNGKKNEDLGCFNLREEKENEKAKFI